MGKEGYCDDKLFHLLTGVDCRLKPPGGNLIYSFSIESLSPPAFRREQLRPQLTSQETVPLQDLYQMRFSTLARWLCYKTVAIESSPLLCPNHQITIVSALPLKAPSEKTLDSVSCWLDARVGRAHESLSQILKAVSRMWSPLDPKIPIF